MRFPPGMNWIGALAIAAAVIIAGAWSVSPQFKDRVTAVTTAGGTQAATGSRTDTGGPAATGPGGGGGSQGSSTTVTTGGGPSGGATPPPGGFQCAAGLNGGATDVGVTGTQIRLASTLAESGVGASFLGDAHYAMDAVIAEQNSKGGICGRQLVLSVADDGWNASTGLTDIRNFIAEKYFALAVMPSSQGLNAASVAPFGSGDIDAAGIPVIGSDGMLFSQYADPLMWPVAASTISTAHVAAKNGYDAGSRTFGIVYDADYKFGSEGAHAFAAALSRLPGAQLKASVPIKAGQQSYPTDVQTFETQCQPCDFTFMLLEPDTAVAWIKSDNSTQHYIFGSKRTAGPQPLFVKQFGVACADLCNNMWVWTGYKAPYPPYDTDPADAEYVQTIRRVSQRTDISNQFLEGAYVGAKLLISALTAVGPNLTRARLRAQLDGMTFDSGLTQPLTWRPGHHFANPAMLGYTIQFSNGFNGFQYQQTGWVPDAWLGQDGPNA